MLSAEIGKGDYLKRVAGKYTLHNSPNDNEIRLVNFATKMNLVISITIYEHLK